MNAGHPVHARTALTVAPTAAALWERQLRTRRGRARFFTFYRGPRACPRQPCLGVGTCRAGNMPAACRRSPRHSCQRQGQPKWHPQRAAQPRAAADMPHICRIFVPALLYPHLRRRDGARSLDSMLQTCEVVLWTGEDQLLTDGGWESEVQSDASSRKKRWPARAAMLSFSGPDWEGLHTVGAGGRARTRDVISCVGRGGPLGRLVLWSLLAWAPGRPRCSAKPHQTQNNEKVASRIWQDRIPIFPTPPYFFPQFGSAAASNHALRCNMFV
eukprot:gene15575-biopygen2169